MKTIAVDLDGTILEYTAYKKYSYEPPIEGAKEFLALLSKKGFRVIVYTARSADERDSILTHLREYGISVDDVVCDKALYLALIDDRAIKFDGDWGAVADQLDNLVEWR